VLDDKGQPRGVLSDYVYSKRFKANIGVGMIASDAKQASLHVVIGDEARKVTLRSLPFDS
ncbi:MAG TPA: glycine cleavage system protein T, partial [Sulfitobacter pontiacus]|nr:glycine cleavage system protein T [Sulfitobacter pontiacus]